MAGEFDRTQDRNLNEALDAIRGRANAMTRREALLQLLRVGSGSGGRGAARPSGSAATASARNPRRLSRRGATIALRPSRQPVQSCPQ